MKLSKAFIFLGLNAPGVLFAMSLIANNTLRTISGDATVFIAPSGTPVGFIALSVAWFVGQAFALLVFATGHTVFNAIKEPLVRLSRVIGVQEYKR
jgi:hypothetical protein